MGGFFYKKLLYTIIQDTFVMVSFGIALQDFVQFCLYSSTKYVPIFIRKDLFCCKICKAAFEGTFDSELGKPAVNDYCT